MRVLMAAGLYLLLMWGYLILQTPQLYAVFTALIMSIALLFWVSEARVVDELWDTRAQSLIDRTCQAGDATQPQDDLPAPSPAIEPTLDACILRLDALKADLTQQYAQFGRDQSLLNSRGLGTWHPDGGERGCGK